jgi:hypothetical protein
MTADGGSRLFVALTQSVPVEERRGKNSLTYVLKGAHVVRFNNERPLVTVHFNTPVSRARLVPSGNDLHFIVSLRAAAAPTFKVDPAKDNGAILHIDFARGDFIPSAVAKAPAPEPESQEPDNNANDSSSDNTGSKGN